MSDSTLLADLEANLAEATKLNELAQASDLVKHLKNTLWPFLQTLVEEVTQIDQVVEDIVHEADDILQPETAEVFAALIVACRAMVTEFTPRVDRAKEPKIFQGLQILAQLCNKAESTLDEVTVPPEDEEDGDDEYEEGEEEDGDDEEDDTEEGAAE